MSQKKNRTNSNTLFNYFSRSPATSTSRKDSDSGQTTIKKAAKENVLCGNNSENAFKRELDSSHDEDIKVIQKKRRRIISESESGCDGEYNCNITKEEKNNFSENTNRYDPESVLTFGRKSINFKDEPNEVIVQNVLENPISTNLEESIIWPHNKFDFLKPENIKDRKGRRPDHPDYSLRTLHVPESFLNTLSPGVRQWWELKSENFDCVLFFKVGKFYELYHMDADIGVSELGLTYMKGEFAHSGFPEISYDRMAATLIDRGYKVARVEQTETHEMMIERCKNQKMITKFDKVVRREICQITNRGTRVYAAQNEITYNHQPSYMLAVVEEDVGLFSTFGVCFIDTSIGDFHIGEFDDDAHSSRLLTLLSHYPPVLVLLEKKRTSVRVENALKTVLTGVLRENLFPDTQFWSAEKCLKFLAQNYYIKSDEKNWPDALISMQNKSDSLGLTPKDDSKLALKALGGCIWYLKQCYIEQQVLNIARFIVYYPSDIQNIKYNENNLLIENTNENSIASNTQYAHHMVLDSITLNNLNVLGEGHSLLNTLDRCCTKFGKRLLHHWICSPSCNINIIKERQNAISELINKIDTLQDMRSLFIDIPDLERHLVQLHGFGIGAKLIDHPDNRAVLFEDKIYNKKKIQNFIIIFRGFKSLVNISNMFSNFKSPLITHLTQLQPIGIYPEMLEVLNYFEMAFNHGEALKKGIITPEKGIDPEFDAVEKEIDDINQKLKRYLQEQEKVFGCRLNYSGNDKKRFQIEVPETHVSKAGSNYFLEGQKKGARPVRRFYTAETKEFLKRMMHAEEQRNNVLKDLTRRIFEKFSNYHALWKKCVDSVAALDVLGSLAEYAKNQNVICVPQIYEESNMPFIHLEEGYHPCVPFSANYIPNGISLGGSENASLFLLTGPNMGGKSTLMRQVGLLMIMAQIGSHIPAQNCRMSVIDRILTRLGAQDDILTGHSTFLVELNETSTILKHSTIHSLVLLDELGRGTATYDGAAVAVSVVYFMANLKCRTLFSTHYYNLIGHFQNDSRIAVGHMACVVENDDIYDATQESVTFLYKCTAGACSNSYGFNAAKLAGMPLSVIQRAFKLSKNVEAVAVKKKIIPQVMQTCPQQIRELCNKLKFFKTI